MYKIYKSSNSFYILSYHIGHSILVFTSPKSNETIEFNGVNYMDIPRIFDACELKRANENDHINLVNRKVDFNFKNFTLWKITSGKSDFFVMGLSVKVYQNDKIIFSDSFNINDLKNNI